MGRPTKSQPGDGFFRRRTTRVRLRDGTRVLIRPVMPEDKARFLDGFARLSPESRYRRFMSPIDELTPDMLREFTEVDYVDHFAYVALLADQPGLPGIGVARYIRLPDDPEVAESAVTVVDEYQGRGLGTLLIEALGAVALENGILRFRGYLLIDNQPMVELVEELGARVEFDSPGLYRVEVDLPRQARELRGSPLYTVFRALARGERPWQVRFREYWTRLRVGG
jgi:GNAT superfamily N-acetyltransferase